MSNRFDLAREQADPGRDTNSIMRLMGQMMRLPFTALFYSMEIFVRTMQGMQRMADQSFNSLVGGIAQNLDDTPECTNPGANTNYQAKREEDRVMMNYEDLSGDDLKYVTYSIGFEKHDLEAPLEPEQQDIVSYSTDGGSYGALKIGELFEKIKAGKVPRPKVWKENQYPPGDAGDYITYIPDEDKRYISFKYRVDWRAVRQDANYDKQQVKELRKIKESIDKVGNKIG